MAKAKKAKKRVRKTKPKRKVVKRRKPAKKRVVKPRRPKGSGSRPHKRASGKKVIRKKLRKKPAKKKAKKAKPKRKVKPKKKISAKKKVVKKKRVIKKKPAKKTVARKRPKKKIVKKTRRKAKPSRRARKPVKRRKVVKKARPKKRVRRKKKTTKPRVYVGKGTLDQLFESQAKVKLLKFFFRNAEEMFQPKEIFKRLRSNIALLRQEMKKLEKLGLLKQRKAWLSFEKKRGGVRRERKTIWHINPNFDFFNELRELVLKSTVASKDELVEKARKIGNIKLLVLTGVFTGDEGAKADLLIVGDKMNQRKLNNFIKDLEAEVGKEINCAVMNTKEFDYRYDMYDRFVRDLLEGNCEVLLKRLELW